MQGIQRESNLCVHGSLGQRKTFSTYPNDRNPILLPCTNAIAQAPITLADIRIIG
jgi:hypothetical protein